MSKRPAARDKDFVARRAHGYCEYCKSRADYSPDTFSIEHEDYTLMIGLTPTGRATVEKLDLNRLGVVNLRRLLLKVRLHPPGI